ncbi:hypothetical protein FQN54_006178 [Arachnomyces sp. PD_36]|nr:hypothetical protein FQN54_006178 [Arachnomyces sp. PD_36]
MDRSAEDRPSLKEILRRTLSAKSAVSTSSFAERMNNARFHEQKLFPCIGRGSCGTIWEQPGTKIVYKTSPDESALWNDFHMTNNVYNSFVSLQSMMEASFPGITLPRIPKASRFFTSSNAWWDITHKKFPPGTFTKQNNTAIQLSRILPLPSQVRDALIQLYFDPLHVNEALADPENKHCLVRLYFGKTRETTDPHPTSLWNFELYLDMAQSLELDVELITKEMAVSLALIHWAAKCDGMDAEWVLGSAASEEVLAPYDPEFSSKQPVDIEPDFKSRTTYLWVLDFDKSRPIEYNQSCIPLILGGVTANDPYLPNPKYSPKPLYRLLARTYLKASNTILRHVGASKEALALPRLFLDAWEEWAQEPESTGFDFDGWGADGSDEEDEDEEDEDDEEGDSSEDDDGDSDDPDDDDDNDDDDDDDEDDDGDDDSDEEENVDRENEDDGKSVDEPDDTNVSNDDVIRRTEMMSIRDT